jgi:hypothetical protein
MDPMRVHVEMELRRLNREYLPHEVQHRMRWQDALVRERPAGERRLAAWLGERLINIGERLRAWASAPARRPNLGHMR